MWEQIANIAPVRPASLAAPPVPRLRNAALGPLAGGGGTDMLAGRPADDMIAPPVVEAPDAAGIPIPRLRSDAARPPPSGTVVDRKPVIRIGSGVKNFAQDFATGLASGDPSAPPIAAFGSGLFGAISSDREREAAEAKAALAAEDRRIAAEDRAYERARDLSTDARLERETEAKIAGGYFTKPDATTKYVDDNGVLTAEGVKEVYGFVNDEIDSLRDFYQQSGLVRRSNAAEIETKIAEYATKYRQDLENAIRAGKSPFEVPRAVDRAAAEEAAKTADPTAAGGAPAAPGGAPVPRIAPGGEAAPAPAEAAPAPGGEAVATPPAGYTGHGTAESPYAGGKGPPPGMKTGQVWTDGTYLYEQE